MGSSRWPRSTSTANWMARGRPKSISASIAARAVRPWWMTSSTSTTILPPMSGTSLAVLWPSGGRRCRSSRCAVTSSFPNTTWVLSSWLRVVASRRASTSPLLTMPTSTTSSVPRFLSTISCAMRDRERRIWERLLRDPGHVDDVDLGQHRVQVLRLDPRHLVLVEVRLQVVAHRHLRRGDEPDLDVLELAEQVGQRASGAAVGEVPDHRHP